MALVLVIAAAGPSHAAPAAKHGEDGKADATDTLRLAPIIVPIIGAGQVVGQAGVKVQLQLANPGDFDAVDQQRARLVDAFISEMYALVDQLENGPHVIEPTIIKEHFMRVADRILGAGKIREVIILGTYEQRSDRPRQPAVLQQPAPEQASARKTSETEHAAPAH